LEVFLFPVNVKDLGELDLDLKWWWIDLLRKNRRMKLEDYLEASWKRSSFEVE